MLLHWNYKIKEVLQLVSDDYVLFRFLLLAYVEKIYPQDTEDTHKYRVALVSVDIILAYLHCVTI